MHGGHRAVGRGGIRCQIGGGDAIAFDGGQPRIPDGRRCNREYSDAGIEIDDVAAGRQLRDNMANELVDEVPIPLKESQHMPPQENAEDDRRRSPRR